MLRRSTALLLLLLGILATDRTARAAPAPPLPAEKVSKQGRRAEAAARPSPAVIAEARRRFGRGNQLYRMGSYPEALLAYQAALDLYAEPVIMYNIAQTYEKLRDPAHAALYFERYLQARPKTPDRAAVQERIARLRQDARVEVAVTSYPPGAAIYVGRREAGVQGRTPFQLRLPLGKQRVLLELSGFVPAVRVVDVKLGEANLIDAQLQRRSSVRVEADVAGATVFLEGRTGSQRHRAPHLFEVDAGRHAVRVELAGYVPVHRMVEVQSGEQISLAVSLKALPRYGRLQVEAVAAAQVIIDGRTAAHLPMQPLVVAAGTYRVSVEREGYRAWEGKVTIEPNRLTVARVRLSPLRGAVTKTVLYGSAGLSIAGLLAGSVYGALALRAERDYNALPERSKLDDGKSKALVADICFAAAGAAALAAVVTYLATERGASSAEVDLTLPGGPLP